MPAPTSTRVEALSILNTSEGKALLSETYGKVIENVQKGTISNLLKNKNLSGDPTSGSVEANRIVNTDSQAYGTARSGGKGQKIKADPVIVQINVDKELINEVEEKDTKLYGVPGLVQRKAAMDEKTMTRELERAFFAEAATGGAKASLKKVKINEKVEELIQLIENTKNDFVDGVPRDMISVTMNTEKYGELRDFLDTTENSNIDTSVGEFGMFHGVRVFSSVYLPSGTDMIGMADESVAQPVMTSDDEAGKIPLSNAYHFGMFYSYGTETVMPDLIQVVNAAA